MVTPHTQHGGREQDPMHETAAAYVAARGGMLDGRWFPADDWAQQMRAAARLAARGQRPMDSYYAPTGQTITHPRYPDDIGVVWEEDPTAELPELDQASAAATPPSPAADQVETRADRSVPAPVKSLRVLVTGSRDWSDQETIRQELDQVREGLASGQRMVLVHGGAAGADALAQEWAQARRAAGDQHVQIEAHPADWRTHGRAAGPRRNTEMVQAGADLCLSFARGDSTGTRHCTELAHRAGIPVVAHTAETPIQAKTLPAAAEPEALISATAVQTRSAKPARRTRNRTAVARPETDTDTDTDSEEMALW